MSNKRGILQTANYAVLGLAIGFLLVAIAVGLYRHDEQRARIFELSQENPIWSIQQLAYEYERFISTLEAHGADPSRGSQEETRLRLDVLWSRLNVIVPGAHFQTYLERIAGGQKRFMAIRDIVAKAEHLLVAGSWEDHQAVDQALAILRTGQPLARRLVVEVNHLQLADRLNQLSGWSRNLNLITFSFLAIVAAVGLLLFLLIRQVRQTRRLLEVAQQAELEMRKFKNDAEAADRAKSQFLSSVSHELRTPLNSILGFSRLLESGDGKNLDDVQRKCALRIGRAGRHLLQLIDQLLDLGRIEAGRLRVHLENVDVLALIDDCVQLTEDVAAKRGLRFAVSSDLPHGHKVSSDHLRLRQVLLNLISNAIKYNDGQGTISITASSGHGNSVRIAVTDRGRGISADLLDSVFDPFTRLSPHDRDAEGSGIGLALSKQLIELLDGRIGVESSLDRGSTFWIELPTVAVYQVAGVETLPLPPQPTRTFDALKKPLRVLYIEDDPANLALLELMAATIDGLTITRAPDAERGLADIEANSPDLVLMDIGLPGQDGYQALKRIRDSRATRELPVIALTAFALNENVEDGRRAGFDGYVTKPFELEELLAAMTSVMQRGPVSTQRRMEAGE